MLPPNYAGSLNNLVQSGIIDYGTAAYVASERPHRPHRYSRLLNPCNPQYNQYDSFCYSQYPFCGGYQQKTFWQKVGTGLLAIGGVYLGGKVFLHLAKGIKNFSLKGLFKSKKSAKAAAKNTRKNKKKASTTPLTPTPSSTASSTANSTSSSTSSSTSGGVFGKKSSFLNGIKNIFANMRGTKRNYFMGKFRPWPFS